jgi:DNA-binding NtrC family response regulator
VQKILILEAEPEIQSLLKTTCGTEFRVEVLTDSNAIRDISPDSYNLIVWHVDGAKNVSALADTIRHFPEHPPIVVITDNEMPPLGPLDRQIYPLVWRPNDANRLCEFVRSLLNRDGPRATGEALNLQVPFEFEGILGTSLAMREIVNLILKAAAVDVAVLITGETGTGKELVAAAIHKRSPRKEFPYVAVNTGAMAPELITTELFGHEKGSYTGAAGVHVGFFEQAHRGTIFLDEISTMDHKTQVALLRILETKSFRRVGGNKDIHVDVRVVAATNENLDEAVKEKKFREDLLYRLDILRIHLPPLRSRPGAVTFLTDHFISHFDEVFHKNIRSVSRETYRYLRVYPWPGNVRELKNVIQRAVLNAPDEELTPDLLPARIREPGEVEIQTDGIRLRPGMHLETAEKELIKVTLAFTKGNKKAAAELLGISRRSLYNKLGEVEQ